MNKTFRKKMANTILATSLTLMSMNNAVAYNNGSFIDGEVLPYFRLDSGWAHFEKVSAQNGLGQKSKLESVSHSIVGAGVGLGINFGDKIRSDITWSHHLSPQLKTDNINNSITRNPVIDAVFLNAYYEMGNIITIFNPYIGAGVGIAIVKDKLFYSSHNNNINVRGSETIKRKSNFAYKFSVGSAFDLNERIKFDVSYNYQNYGKSKSKLVNIGGTDIQMGKTNYRAHIISAGMRFGM